MINSRQLKAILAFAQKKCGVIVVDFDHNSIFTTDGPSGIVVKNVDGLCGEGMSYVPLNVAESASVLLGENKFVTATIDSFCGIPYEPSPGVLKIDTILSLPANYKLTGSPGLYKSEQMRKLDRLLRVFCGEYVFYLPETPDKPLVLEIRPDECEERPEGIEHWNTPTEIVQAAIMPNLYNTHNLFTNFEKEKNASN